MFADRMENIEHQFHMKLKQKIIDHENPLKLLKNSHLKIAGGFLKGLKSHFYYHVLKMESKMLILPNDFSCVS